MEMSDVLFNGYGIQVVTRNGKYYIRYDGGHLISQTVELEIDQIGADKATRSEKDAYDVIMDAKRKNKT